MESTEPRIFELVIAKGKEETIAGTKMRSVTRMNRAAVAVATVWKGQKGVE